MTSHGDDHKSGHGRRAGWGEGWRDEFRMWRGGRQDQGRIITIRKQKRGVISLTGIYFFFFSFRFTGLKDPVKSSITVSLSALTSRDPQNKSLKRGRPHKTPQEQRRAPRSALKMLKTQLTHSLAIKQPLRLAGTILHCRLINQSHAEISICITKCAMSARSSAAV